ncbi:MAG: hypothetical protein HQ515_24455 [Phycisphaeraceae bacterium]|nr:hypothetical protein [Phycisphaeraceae bacterium]
MNKRQHAKAIDVFRRTWEKVYDWHLKSTVVLSYNNPALGIGPKTVD